MSTFVLDVFWATFCVSASALHLYSGADQPKVRVAKATGTFFGPNTETTYDIGHTEPPPSGLHGKNLLLVGDSNDREIVEYMCSLYGGKIRLVQMMSCGDETL